jgi:thiol-disulfide isomerase/thioredoxin
MSDYLTENDTLELYCFNDIIGAAYLNPYRLFTQSVKDGICTFVLDSIGQNSRFSLAFDYQKIKGAVVGEILSAYPVSGSDDITIVLTPLKGVYLSYGGGYDNGQPVVFDNWHCTFTGNGTEKYQVRYNALAFSNYGATSEIARRMKMPIGYGRTSTYLTRIDSVLGLTFRYVDNNSEKLSEEDKVLIKADALARLSPDRIRAFEQLKSYLFRNSENIRNETDSLKMLKKAFFDEPLDRFMQYYGTYLHKSPDLIGYYARLKSMEYYQAEGNTDMHGLVNYLQPLMQQWDSRLSERVIANVFRSKYHDDSDPVFYNEVLSGMSDLYVRKYMEELSSVSLGRKALSFSLPDGNGRYHSLEDLKGKVVFIDFWYLGCVPCRFFIEHTLRPVSAYFADESDVVFITISADKKETFVKAFKTESFLPENVLHLYTEDQAFKHPLIKGYAISSYPFPLLIDRRGRIYYSGSSLHNVDTFKTAVEKLLSSN